MESSERPDRDRRARQADRLARILTVLRLIQSRGQWNAKAIAQELEVTERTVYRDLQALEFAGVPWHYDSEAESYRVRSDYRFPVPNLTEDEIIGQAVASAITQAANLAIAGDASKTTQKIAAASSEDVKQLLADAESVISVLGLQIADHSGREEIAKTIQHALIHKKQIKGQYRSPYEPTAVELHLNPFRLCLVKNAWYLIGQPVSESEPRTYRIARFESVEIVDAPATLPDAFDIRAYFGNAWAVYRGAESFDVRIRFSPDAAKHVTETQWHHTQEVHPQDDGSVELTFRVDGLEEICNWLMPWAPNAKVEEPRELRELLVKKLSDGLKNQQDS
jgi:predicted DNA-binding transcriptional regulator YafY